MNSIKITRPKPAPALTASITLNRKEVAAITGNLFRCTHLGSMVPGSCLFVEMLKLCVEMGVDPLVDIPDGMGSDGSGSIRIDLFEALADFAPGWSPIPSVEGEE